VRLQNHKFRECEHRTLQVVVSLLLQARGDGTPNRSKLEHRIANNSLVWKMVHLTPTAASEMLGAYSMLVFSNELELVTVLSPRNALRVVPRVHVLRMNFPRAEVKMRMEAVVAYTLVNTKAVPSCDHFVLWQ